MKKSNLKKSLRNFTLNFGSQHPAARGVLRLVLDLTNTISIISPIEHYLPLLFTLIFLVGFFLFPKIVNRIEYIPREEQAKIQFLRIEVDSIIAKANGCASNLTLSEQKYLEGILYSLLDYDDFLEFLPKEKLMQLRSLQRTLINKQFKK